MSVRLTRYSMREYNFKNTFIYSEKLGEFESDLMRLIPHSDHLAIDNVSNSGFTISIGGYNFYAILQARMKREHSESRFIEISKIYGEMDENAITIIEPVVRSQGIPEVYETKYKKTVRQEGRRAVITKDTREIMIAWWYNGSWGFHDFDYYNKDYLDGLLKENEELKEKIFKMTWTDETEEGIF
jgi:hypothetical protein